MTIQSDKDTLESRMEIQIREASKINLTQRSTTRRQSRIVENVFTDTHIEWIQSLQECDSLHLKVWLRRFKIPVNKVVSLLRFKAKEHLGRVGDVALALPSYCYHIASSVLLYLTKRPIILQEQVGSRAILKDRQ